MTKTIFYFVGCLVLIILNSCSNEHIEPVDEQTTNSLVNNGRVKVETTQDLEILQNNLINGNISGKDFGDDFKNLYSLNLENNKTKSGGEDYFYNDTLVPDTSFAKILNIDREIQVGDFIYRITPKGTFFCTDDKYLEMIQSISNFVPPIVEYTNCDEERLSMINDGIYRYDTFGESFDEFEVEMEDDIDLKSTKSGEPDISTFKKCRYSAKTWVGKQIAGIFGRNKWESTSFNSRRRVQVKFYNFNYVIKQEIGISVRFRKKNWIGWSGTRCKEMRLGFEGIIYQAGYNDGKKHEWDEKGSQWPWLHRVGETSWNSANHKQFCVVYYDDAMQLDKLTLSEALTNAQNRAFKALTLAGARFPLYGYGDKPVAVVLDEDHHQTFYIGEITHKFYDRKRVDIKLASKFDGEISASKDIDQLANFMSTDGWDAKIKPGSKFGLKKLSVYGCAKYDDRWKGIKIIME
jgi:hypothetical protein